MKKYKPKVSLWPHQLKALAKMKGKEAFGLLMQMRTGKTPVTLADFGQLELDGKVKDFLLIAPAGVYRTWLTAMREHFSDDLRERCFVHTYSSGAGKKEKEELRQLLDGNIKGPRILLVNVEALSRPGPARGVCEKFLKRGKNYVVIDECFPAGTNISTPDGERPIETLEVGDEVVGSFSNERIKTIKKNEVETLVNIRFSNGKILRTTVDHPCFTDLGWIEAEQLNGRMLYDQKSLRNLQCHPERESKEVQIVHNKKANARPKDEGECREIIGKSEQGQAPLELCSSETSEMSNLQKEIQSARKEQEKILQQILLSEMAHGSAGNKGKNSHEGTKRKGACNKKKEWNNLRRGWLEQEYSNENIIKKKTEQTVERDRSHIQRAWRQWKAAAKSARVAIEVAWIGLAARVSNSNKRWKKAQRLSSMLQSRYWQSEKEACDRVRRTEPQYLESSSTGQEEGRQAQGIRVESVTIEKLTNPVTVFNLELEGTPHFFAEGVLVHNCTVIKNKSKRTDYVLKFIQPLATYRRILSGLATPRSPLDLYYQFFFLDWEILGWRSYYTFRAAVAVMATQWFGGRSVQVVVGYRDEAVAELQKLIEPASFRVPFRPDIPSTWSIREVTMTPDQKRHYNEIKEFATTALSATEHVTATVVIAQLMRMHQVLCGHVRDENGTVHTLPENKTSELLELLEDYDGKAIIWCSYDHDVRKLTDKLTEKYGEGCVARFWGGNERTREQEEVRFKSEPDCRFMLATPGAGGRGRTWVCADLVVYYSSTDNLEHRDQSEQRAMGIGKKRQVDFVDLIHPGTVEMKILEALRKKINMSSIINGDNYKSWII